MEFLGNNELGFHAQTLGFPSIHTCHAIVYQTANGIYGFHSMGGQIKSSWTPRAAHFAQFVKNHAGGIIPAGTRLYGCAYVCESGRYSPKNTMKQQWKEELTDFATALGYGGRISGYQLNKSLTGKFSGTTSAYVEYDVTGIKCNVSVRQWGVNEHLPAPTPNGNPADHQRMHPNNGAVAMANIVTGINRVGINQISKEKLR